MLKSDKNATGAGGPGGRAANILLPMSGSIACAKASSLISEWTKKGHEVRVACTRSVAGFVGGETLEVV